MKRSSLVFLVDVDVKISTHLLRFVQRFLKERPVLFRLHPWQQRVDGFSNISPQPKIKARATSQIFSKGGFLFVTDMDPLQLPIAPYCIDDRIEAISDDPVDALYPGL